MSINNDFELEALKEKVSQVYGGRISTTNDFLELSESINEKTRQFISDSTLKRIWGYVNYNPHPHRTTLDILSKYIGYDSYRHFCNSLQQSSSFFSCEKIVVSELSVGKIIRIGWAPDRAIELEYLGSSRFRVSDAGTSKLRAGDLVEACEFIKGTPMFFAKVIRQGEELPSYVAGKSSGLTNIELIL